MSVIPSTITAGSSNYLTPSKDVMPDFRDSFHDGVALGFHVEAQGAPNMTVKVKAGKLIMTATPTSEAARRFSVVLSADANVTIPSNATGSTRYDIVYMKLPAANLQNPPVTGDFTEAVTLLTERHTISGEPLTDTNGFILAEVTVANGAVSISNANISITAEDVNDGWIPFPAIPTFATATTMNIAGDWRRFFQKGDPIFYTQLSGTAVAKKYAVVTADATFTGGVTTVTVSGGTDFTIANAAILKAYVGRGANPIGFPGVFNYLPTLSANGGMTYTATTITLAQFSIKRNEVFVMLNFFGTTGGGASNALIATSPVTTTKSPSGAEFGGLPARVNDVAVIAGVAYLDTSATHQFLITRYDGANYSLGAGRAVRMQGTYFI